MQFLPILLSGGSYASTCIPSGNGRWYVRELHPDGGPTRRRTVASSRARLSAAHDIMEQRAGRSARDTLDWLWGCFKESTEFKALAKGTQRGYEIHAELLKNYPTRTGTFGLLRLNVLTTPIIQRLVEAIAKGQPESRPGSDNAIKPRPSTANHALRYMRRLFAWGIRFGHCLANPAQGVKQAAEASKAKGAAQKKLPRQDAFQAVLAYARERGAYQAHTAGSCPPYMAPVMEIAYACRLRGIEVTDLTDAHILDEGLLCLRRKGSVDNITRWTPALRAAVADLQVIRKRALERHGKDKIHRLRSEERPLLVAQDGGRRGPSEIQPRHGVAAIHGARYQG